MNAREALTNATWTPAATTSMEGTTALVKKDTLERDIIARVWVCVCTKVNFKIAYVEKWMRFIDFKSTNAKAHRNLIIKNAWNTLILSRACTIIKISDIQASVSTSVRNRGLVWSLPFELGGKTSADVLGLHVAIDLEAMW